MVLTCVSLCDEEDGSSVGFLPLVLCSSTRGVNFVAASGTVCAGDVTGFVTTAFVGVRSSKLLSSVEMFSRWSDGVVNDCDL